MVLVYCPRTNNVLAMYWVSTSPFAPSDMKICKEDIDQRKIHGVSVNWDLHMLEASMGNTFKQLERVEDRVDGCYAETRRVCSLSKTNSRSLGMEIQRVQREA